MTGSLVAAVAVAAFLAVEEDAVLKRHLPSDADAALLAFLRQRSPGPDELAELRRLVARLGSDDFDARERASQALPAWGPVAVPFLEAARKSADLEVVRRARLALDDIAAGPGPALPVAALRALAARRVVGAEAALLRYAPHADDEAVEDEVVRALAALAGPGRPVEPAVVAALADAAPARRAAAGYALAAHAAHRPAVAKLLGDADAAVRFRAGLGLAEAGDKAGVPALIDLLAGPGRWAGRAEDVLLRLAGETAPPAAGPNPRDRWAAWWREHRDAADLARLTRPPPPLGLTVVACAEAGTVAEYGRDGSPRWKLAGLAGPIDAHALDGGRVLVAEAAARRVTERDRAGTVLWRKDLDQAPVACQRLANGHTFIATYTGVLEVRRDGSEVYRHDLKAGPCRGYGVYAAQRLANGHVVALTRRGAIVVVDAAGAVVRAVSVAGHGCTSVEALAGGGYLVVQADLGKVVEYAADGKPTRELAVAGAFHATRLANGNTLVSTRSGNKVVEIDAAGQAVAEWPAEAGVGRVHRR